MGSGATPSITASAIATNGDLSCAIQAGTGAVVCWGANDSGQATPPPSVDGTVGTASAIAAGAFHSCAIQAGTGAVVCWGDNASGQATPPPSVDGTAGTASAIAAGDCHSCAIQAGTGAVVCWGGDYLGQATPPPSVNGTAGTASAIAAGVAHSCAIQAGTGAVVCWGANDDGQATPPPSVNGTAGTASAIAAGCAPQLRDPGRQRRGRLLGLRTTPGRRRRLPPSNGTAAPPRRSRRARSHSCAIQAGSGAVVCWGDNDATGRRRRLPPWTAPRAPPRRSRRARSTAARSRPAPARSSAGATTPTGRRRRLPPWTAPPAPPRRSRRAATTAARSRPAPARSSAGASGRRTGRRRRLPPWTAPPARASAIAAGGVPQLRDPGRQRRGRLLGLRRLRAGDAASLRGRHRRHRLGDRGGRVSTAARSRPARGAVVCWGDRLSYGQATPPPSVDGTAGTASAIAAGAATAARSRPAPARSSAGARHVLGQTTPPPSVDGTAGTASAIAAGDDPQLRDPGRQRRGRLLGPRRTRASDAAFLRRRHDGERHRDHAGLGHTCAIQAGTGAVVCWGDDSFGQSTPSPFRRWHRRPRHSDRGGRRSHPRDRAARAHAGRRLCSRAAFCFSHSRDAGTRTCAGHRNAR